MTALVPADRADLEADPVQYMAAVLNRAKSWLEEAVSISDVRDTKAIALGYESVLREKELAFDAQLSATEIVRRCERRIGELVKVGQRDGSIVARGDNGHTIEHRSQGADAPLRSTEIFVSSKERRGSYVMTDAPPAQFEQAIAEAREEGNLSRANVVRKVKDQAPASERSEWQKGRRRLDSNRILTVLAQELDALSCGLDVMQPAEIDPGVRAECTDSIKESIRTINSHLRRIS